FYNERRKALAAVEPNEAHRLLRKLEEHFDVYVITQNVDDLHERAGSSKVLHLHGELTKVRAVDDPSLIYPLPGYDSSTTPDSTVDGHKVRPHIVFFQEAVPMFEPATEIAAEADIFVIIGTSLAVYPAASLLHYVRPGVPVYYIDPRPSAVPDGVTVIRATATEGMKQLYHMLVKD
ncbi:MAG: NAD-dependent deacylase, partial [Muribaculaceae bacterium]|nr:NAD-dependent deacylase [Muribaculaceae bacterium]